MSDLKRVLIEYNDLPNRYLEEEYKDFLQSDYDLLFVHIRESDQIGEFKQRVSTKCVTIIVRSSIIEDSNTIFGNVSDDNVEEYEYDYIFQNGKPLNLLTHDFIAFLKELFTNEGLHEV